MKKKLESKKGFTLAELLIVVAIIAVLVAISIPVFTQQLENSREATDAANIRSAYAEVMVEALNDPSGDYTRTIAARQTQDGWQNTTIENIGGVPVGGSGIQAHVNGGTWTVTWNHETSLVTIDGIAASGTSASGGTGGTTGG